MPSPRHPLPTAIKIARGNPGKRALNRREPQPTVGLPSAPAALSPGAQAVWQAVGPALLALGVLTEVDGPALAGLCALEALFARIAPEVDTMPLAQEAVTVDGAGQEHTERRMDPGVKTLLDVLRERRAQHAQFGLTPSSRAKLVVDRPQAADPLEEALH